MRLIDSFPSHLWDSRPRGSQSYNQLQVRQPAWPQPPAQSQGQPMLPPRTYFDKRYYFIAIKMIESTFSFRGREAFRAGASGHAVLGRALARRGRWAGPQHRYPTRTRARPAWSVHFYRQEHGGLGLSASSGHPNPSGGPGSGKAETFSSRPAASGGRVQGEAARGEPRRPRGKGGFGGQKAPAAGTGSGRAPELRLPTAPGARARRPPPAPGPQARPAGCGGRGRAHSPGSCPAGRRIAGPGPAAQPPPAPLARPPS